MNCKDGPSFTYDQVYGGGAQPSSLLYEQCVQPLVNGLFKGYNACCFAYGQTGSGKTYTMGSSTLMPGPSEQGVIPKVMQDIFQRIAAAQDTDFTVRVGFVEIFNVSVLFAIPSNSALMLIDHASHGVLFLQTWPLSEASVEASNVHCCWNAPVLVHSVYFQVPSRRMNV